MVFYGFMEADLEARVGWLGWRDGYIYAGRLCGWGWFGMEGGKFSMLGLRVLGVVVFGEWKGGSCVETVGRWEGGTIHDGFDGSRPAGGMRMAGVYERILLRVIWESGGCRRWLCSRYSVNIICTASITLPSLRSFMQMHKSDKAGYARLSASELAGSGGLADLLRPHAFTSALNTL